MTKCLGSLLGKVEALVYVDSGSIDTSVATACALGANVVYLDGSLPFTAARARNEGLKRLFEVMPNADYVQFVDGDCELDHEWIARAGEILEREPQVAAVAGRLRERFPEASIYNGLCDMEWAASAGETSALGGISMWRIGALRKVGAFDTRLIAGEEPELCVRMRMAGWRLLRVTELMGWHDAAMTSFWQWWRRAVRAGHAYAEGAAIHGSGPLRHNVRQVRSTLLWGAAVPGAATGCAVAAVWQPLCLGGIAAILIFVAAQWGRIIRGCRARGFAPKDARLYATFCLIGKAAGALGVARYWINRTVGRRSRLIEYK